MIDPVAIGLVLAGVVLLFGGATLSSYGVGLAGAIVGGAGGYLVVPSIAAAAGVAGPIGLVAGVLIGAGVGVLLTYMLFSMVVAGVSFVAGTLLGWSVIAPALVSGAWYIEVLAAVGIGVLAAAFGTFMTKTAMVFISSYLGAVFASRSITFADLDAAREAISPDPLLFDPVAPILLGLFALGVLTQFGLFKLGYVTKVLGVLPGARALRNRGDED
ncbi:phosphate ABC transporter permease [Halalkalirubrum salinum]|uniref:phosphate ABC transporter permease n=1 Tax=Halalkalirubrum salinum TaxID=2563889 RepID=UPI0010FAE5C8|nr:phosphate ABC transporter permease [Halalkalirubrum salinum]